GSAVTPSPSARTVAVISFMDCLPVWMFLVTPQGAACAARAAAIPSLPVASGRGRRSVTLDLDAKAGTRGGEIVVDRVMMAAPVVPERDRVRLPAESVAELGRPAMLDEEPC